MTVPALPKLAQTGILGDRLAALVIKGSAFLTIVSLIFRAKFKIH